MTIPCGKMLRVRLFKDGSYAELEGERESSGTLNGEQVDKTDKSNSGWRELLEGCGINSATVNFSGLVTDGDIQAFMHSKFFSKSFVDIEFNDGVTSWSGKFEISNIERNGSYNGAEQITATFESASVVSADLTAPLSFSIAPSITVSNVTSFEVEAGTNLDSTIYVVAVPDGDPAPTFAEVKAGQANGGGAAIAADSASATAAATVSMTLLGLVGGTNYDLYFVAESTAPVQQISPVLVEGTTDAAYLGPVWAPPPSVSVFYSVGFDVTAGIDRAGIVHAIALADGAPAPTSAQIRDKTAPGILAFDVINTPGGQTETFVLRGLNATTNYDLYFVSEDTFGEINLAPLFVDATTISSAVYNDVADYGWWSDAATTWDAGNAPVVGAQVNIDSNLVAIRHGPFGFPLSDGLQGRVDTNPISRDRIIDLSGSGSLEVGSTFRDGVGGYYPMWGNLQNTTISIYGANIGTWQTGDDLPMLGFQYVGDFNSADTEGTIIYKGGRSIWNCLQDNQIMAYDIRLEADSVLDFRQHYSNASDNKDYTHHIHGLSVDYDLTIEMRAGLHEIAYRHAISANPELVGDRFQAAVQSRDEFTGVGIVSTDSATRTWTFDSPVPTSIERGQFLDTSGITHAAADSDQSAYMIESIAPDGLSLVTVDPVIDAGASTGGTLYAGTLSNIHLLTQWFFVNLSIGTGKTLDMACTHPPELFGISDGLFTYAIEGVFINNGTFRFDTTAIKPDAAQRGNPQKSFCEISAQTLAHPNTVLGDIRVGGAEFRIGEAKQDFSYDSVVSYSRNTYGETEILLSGMGGFVIPEIGAVDGTLLPGIVNSSGQLILDTPVDQQLTPVMPGMLIRRASAATSTTQIIRAVAADNRTITVDGAPLPENPVSENYRFQFVETTARFDDITDSCGLRGLLALVRRVLPWENKLVIARKLEQTYTLSAAQGQAVQVSGALRTGAVIPENSLDSGTFTLTDSILDFGYDLGLAGPYRYGGHFIFAGTNTVHFGGQSGNPRVIGVLELSLNSSIDFARKGNADSLLTVEELRVNGNSEITSSGNNERNGKEIAIDSASGSGRLTFRPRPDIADNSAIQLLRFQTSPQTLSGGLVVDRPTGNSQDAVRVDVALTLGNLTIDGTPVAPGTYVPASSLAGFTGSGTVDVLA